MSTLKESAKQATIDLIKTTNAMNGQDEVVAGIMEALRGEHRTLQQSFWRAMFNSIEQYAGSGYDLRNEASVKACEKLSSELKDIYLPFV